MVEDTAQVEIVEKVGMLGHLSGVVHCHELEGIYELAPVHDFHLPQNLTDHVFELVVHQEGPVALLGVLDHLVSDGGSWIGREVPVGKLMGVLTWVIALSIMSDIVLERATEPLSPTLNIW